VELIITACEKLDDGFGGGFGFIRFPAEQFAQTVPRGFALAFHDESMDLFHGNTVSLTKSDPLTYDLASLE
jgi:hypothetical protein